jgi:hypothetical protein
MPRERRRTMSPTLVLANAGFAMGLALGALVLSIL